VAGSAPDAVRGASTQAMAVKRAAAAGRSARKRAANVSSDTVGDPAVQGTTARVVQAPITVDRRC